MSKLWQKSSDGTQSNADQKVESFTVGNDYILDQQLVPFDIRASKVHAKALHKAGILSGDECKQLIEALTDILDNWNEGQFRITVHDEDMHTAIENYLTEQLGDLGKKIHTGRSRNDQVLTAVRLFEKEKLGQILAEAKKCALLLLDMADEYENVPMPGYTHTRKAMLSSVGLWAGGYAELLIMQIQAATGIQSLIDRSPLGTAAGFGTSFDIDREFEAGELGFAVPLICSTTAQLSRGWVEVQLVHYLMSITSVLNRLASDIIQFSSEATPFFDLDEIICTGSSIMPQKKNPDVAELIRAGHSELAGQSAILQSVTANLGSGYHRDLQLTKEPVLKAFSKTTDLLEAAQLLIKNITPNTESLKQACSDELFAAEAANKLVKEKGISFRDAYRELKNNPELSKSVSIDKLIREYQQLGSPGNTGIKHLREMLDSE